MPAKFGKIFGEDIIDFSEIIFKQCGNMTSGQLLDFQWLVNAYDKANGRKIKTNIESELCAHIDKNKVALDIPVNVLQKMKQSAERSVNNWDSMTDVVVFSHDTIDVVNPDAIINNNRSFFGKMKDKFKKVNELTYPAVNSNMVYLQSSDVAEKLPLSTIDASLTSIASKVVLLDSKDKFLFASYIPSLKKDTIVIGDKKITLGMVPLVAKGLGQVQQSVIVSQYDHFNRISANTSILSDVVPMYCELIAIDNVSDKLQKAHLYNDFFMKSKKAARALKKSTSNVNTRLKNMQILYGAIISTELFYNAESGFDCAKIILNNIGQLPDHTIMKKIGISNPVLKGQAAFENMAEVRGKQFKKLYNDSVQTKAK